MGRVSRVEAAGALPRPGTPHVPSEGGGRMVMREAEVGVEVMEPEVEGGEVGEAVGGGGEWWP